MRKFLSVLLVSLLIFSFTACGSEKDSQGSGEGSTETSVQESNGKDVFSQEENAIQITIGDITYCEAHHNRTLITGFAQRFL